MGLIQKTIADGIRLRYLETEKFKTNFLSVSFIAPLEAESAAYNALIPAILLRGCESCPTMADINKRLDYLYAASLSSRCFKRGDRQIFGITADMIDPSYAIGDEDIVSDVTALVGDILLHPISEGEAFCEAYTESEKSNLIDAIRAKINDKTAWARIRCIAEMCKNERYSIPETGTEEAAAACTAAEAYARHRENLRRCPIEIFFVGRCDIDRLADQLRSLFAGIDRDPMPLPVTEIIDSAESVRSISEDMPVTQGKLTMGFRAGCRLGDENYTAFMLFNEIFGGGVTSKLFMNVREKMSLCYYCHSSPDAAKGLMMVSSGIEVKNREIAEKAILDQLEAVRRGEFTEEEYEGALLGIINSYRELADSARGLEVWYLGRLLEGITCDPDCVIEDLKKITRDQIVAAANRVSLDTVYFLNGTLKGEEEEDA